MDNKTHNLGPAFWLSVFWIVVLVVFSSTADLWVKKTPDEMDWNNLNAAPCTRDEKTDILYWLGTDGMGRDILSRIVYGARISLSIGLAAPLIGFLVGGLLGCAAGFHRRGLEFVIVAAMDIVLAFPGLLLVMAVSFFMGPSLATLIVSFAILSIPAFCRVARARALSLGNLEFVQAARLTGASNFSILMREIIPNVALPLAIYALLVVAFMIMAEGSLSFLGLGVPAPAPSWGRMIAEGRDVLDQHPHVSLIPAAILFLTVLAFNLIGDHLRHFFEHGKKQL